VKKVNKTRKKTDHILQGSLAKNQRLRKGETEGTKNYRRNSSTRTSKSLKHQGGERKEGEGLLEKKGDGTQPGERKKALDPELKKFQLGWQKDRDDGWIRAGSPSDLHRLDLR